MSLLDRLKEPPRAVLFIAIVASVIIPAIYPLGLPVPTDPHVQGYLDAYNALKEGDTIFYGLSITQAYLDMGEAGSEFVGIMRDLMGRGVNVVIASYQDGSGYFAFTYWLDKYAVQHGLDDLYGDRYVYLGFFAGGETALAGLLEDTRKGDVDYRGTPLDEIPCMNGINDADDFAAMADASCCRPEQAIRQASRYNMILLSASGRQYITNVLPYYEAGILPGYLSGQRDIAAFERAIGRPHAAVKFMDAQSTAHIVYVGAIISANIVLLLNSFRREGRGEN